MNHFAFCAAAHHASSKASALRESVLQRLDALVPAGRQRERLLGIGATGLLLIAGTGSFAGHLTW